MGVLVNTSESKTERGVREGVQALRDAWPPRNREEEEKCLLECKGEAHAEDPPKRVQAKKEDGPRGLPLAWSPRTGEDSEAPNRTQALGNRVRC